MKKTLLLLAALLVGVSSFADGFDERSTVTPDRSS